MRFGFFLFVLLIQFCQVSGQEKPFPNSQFISVDGINLHYRVWEPQGSVLNGNILFLHGFVSSTYSWRNNCDYFAEQGFRVIALDLPCFGYSDRPKGFDHSPNTLANLVWSFLEQAQPSNKWHIVGHSTSGNIVTAMALTKPEQLETVTIVDGMIQGVESSPFYDAVSGTMQIGIVREVAGLINALVLFDELVFTDFLALAYFRKPSQEVVENYTAPFKTFRNKRKAFDLFRIKEPIDLDAFYKNPPEFNLIWGENDPWIPKKVAERIKRRTGKGTVYTIPKAGHTPMETHAEEFNAILLEVID